MNTKSDRRGMRVEYLFISSFWFVSLFIFGSVGGGWRMKQRENTSCPLYSRNDRHFVCFPLLSAFALLLRFQFVLFIPHL
ncbi:hypothetical protein CI102_6082 [Trichoderma harzianum]|nr:hypothetical protein CI102_6082 [Trichoderma harzianum]